MTQQTFANFIGMSAASLSSIFNNRTEPTLKTVRAIKGKIPNLSIEWLIDGIGSMYEDDNTVGAAVLDNAVSDAGGHVADVNRNDTPDLFGVPSEQKTQSYPVRQQVPQVVRPEVRYVERPQRKITEIRIFFDDGTYETFAPKS